MSVRLYGGVALPVGHDPTEESVADVVAEVAAVTAALQRRLEEIRGEGVVDG